MKRFVSLILAMLMLLSTSAFAASLQWDFFVPDSNTDSSANSTAGYAVNDYVLIHGGDCHVRDFPNIYGVSLGVLKNGDTAQCLGGKSTDSRGVLWYEISYKGKVGWVSSQYAYLNGEGVQPSYVKISGGNCNMRDYPSLNGAKLTVLKAGATAEYLSQTSTDNRGVDWYYVSYNGYNGWVSSKYAKFTDSAESSSSSSSSSSSYYGYVKATSHKVNLRDYPSLSGKDIGTMDKGETATYLGEQSVDYRGVIWYKVRFAGKTGWISDRYTDLYY